MQKINKLILAVSVIMLVASCGNGTQKVENVVADKRAQLEKLKKEKEATDKEILALQAELAKIDTSSSNPAKVKLVSLTPAVRQEFSHFIVLQGKVDAENISYISPRGMGGQVRSVLVKQGDNVRKGQLLLRLDDAVQRQQVAAARQQSEGVKTQLALAKSLYQKQKNLWDQGIGTQVQLLTAETNVNALENQLSLIAQQVKVAQEQLNTANVYSDVAGVADIVNIRVGETFQGMTAAGPQIKIVNTSALKVVSNIPENYLGTVNKGTPVIVELPDAHKTINTTVSFTGASIDLINRGFVVEAKLPTDKDLKPNQIALMKIRDYVSANALAIPLNILQNDEKGKFVMVAVNENGKLFARKKPVVIGTLSGSLVEVKSGITEGDSLITEGYTGVYEGQQLSIGK